MELTGARAGVPKAVPPHPLASIDMWTVPKPPRKVGNAAGGEAHVSVRHVSNERNHPVTTCCFESRYLHFI